MKTVTDTAPLALDELRAMGAPVTTTHRELAAGRWFQLSLVEQMANVGSDVEYRGR